MDYSAVLWKQDFAALYLSTYLRRPETLCIACVSVNAKISALLLSAHQHSY